jgi:arsenate reductase (thioredoxin)
MNRVVFACVHNAGRSQMAAAFFNHLADPAKATALSAGTEPGPRVHPEVLATMKELGLDLSRAMPRLLTAEVAADARYLITMGCGDECPLVPGVEILDWPFEDPKDKPIERVREVRDDVRRRVQEFVDANGWGRSNR